MSESAVKIIPHCGICEPDADPKSLMGDALEATCAHCGSLVTRHRRWKADGPGILRGEDVFVCQAAGRAVAKTFA